MPLVRVRLALLYAFLLVLCLLVKLSPGEAQETPVQHARAPGQLKITTIMKKAAYDYPSVHASEKQIEATRSSKTGALLSAISVSSSLGYNQNKTTTTTFGESHQTQQKGRSFGLGAQLSLSLSMWFQQRSFKLTEETQKAALQALQMELAFNAAEVYMDYFNADGRITYLRNILQTLRALHEKVASGQLAISSASQSILQAQIDSTQSSLDSVEARKESAAANMEKYLGEAPSLLRASISEASRKAMNADCGYDKMRSSYKGIYPYEIVINWEYVNQFFPTPDTPEEAFERAQAAPALVQSDLSRKSASNQWYLTLSASGPRVILRVDRNTADTLHQPGDIDTRSRGTSFMASFHFDLDGGFVHRLKADGLLEEAAQHSKNATERQILASIKRTYVELKETKKQIMNSERSLLNVVDALAKIQPTDDDSLGNYLTLISNLDSFSSQISHQIAGFILTRIQIHNLMGTLLKEIERIDGTPL